MPVKSIPADAANAPDLATIDITTVLHSLADPVRLEIVRQLAAHGDEGELTCGQLELPVGKSTCSHHLKALAGAGVIAEREQGTRKYLRLRRAELDRHFPGLVELVVQSGDSS